MSELSDTVKKYHAPVERHEERAFTLYKLWRQDRLSKGLKIEQIIRDAEKKMGLKYDL